MRRRDILLGAATAALGWRAAAQEAPKSAHIGFIVTGDAFPRRWFDEAMQRLVQSRFAKLAERCSQQFVREFTADRSAGLRDLFGSRAQPIASSLVSVVAPAASR